MGGGAQRKWPCLLGYQEKKLPDRNCGMPVALQLADTRFAAEWPLNGC
ncbi:Hypothetical protein GbCGDNIH9_1587 [Granulibacter bethesdensis]|uniref:Uncharacterized protein n=1 Tax=Granulibacter bethesdensis TaxID=364410 RepID=A0AAC9KEP7_9PROT|nr:Hypothetical protein GbCGDNIH9_1587 [Granulibacter bethesdensis]APH62464.1 Hypothetical protein GbCGDNIH8_8592 [Granulibacter bethesdensis]